MSDRNVGGRTTLHNSGTLNEKTTKEGKQRTQKCRRSYSLVVHYRERKKIEEERPEKTASISEEKQKIKRIAAGVGARA